VTCGVIDFADILITTPQCLERLTSAKLNARHHQRLLSGVRVVLFDESDVSVGRWCVM
jgi:hypothetical protein